ncbi:unnamed protein product [Arabis nemorensis]|uniref:Endoglucanase n=1 Tax=Arabis nemorensis TaxID=586526 RepID=A0A565CM77_9BRAS|nr:unnamed protein product [Arabis nemorensis]
MFPAGKLPEHNHVPWRGDSCLEDGNFPGSSYKDLVGGYYDAGDAIKFNFPMSFAMTMLSWSVIEYSAKYEAAGELNHVKQLIKWGTDYFLKTFNSSADTIYQMVTQVGSGNTDGPNVVPNDHYCWMRPEDIDYQRPVSICYSSCSDLAAEMAASLASASIVFKDDKVYSRKLVHGAKTLHEFAKSSKGRYSPNSQESSKFYNSSMYWDELIWGGAWMYFATGNVTYLDRVTSHALAKNAGAFSGGPYYGVFSWDNKLAGAQVLLSRLRLFLSPGYPYEDMLSNFHNQTNIVMCSYLPYFNKFNRTKGGLIQLNHGGPQPLQYAANAAFLAALYSDYLDAADTPGWFWGTIPETRTSQRSFNSEEQKETELQRRMEMEREQKQNPNRIEGAMVAGPDKHDGFHDVRTNYNYTEPTLAGNAGLSCFQH